MGARGTHSSYPTSPNIGVGEQVIFPGGCCPSVAALTAAMAKNTSLTLTCLENFGPHYGETLRRWRANFNAALDDVVRPLGFDDAFIRTWNYYLTYCEAGFSSQTLGLHVLTFSRAHNAELLLFAPGRADGGGPRVAVPVGPFTNDAGTPVLAPEGAW